MRPPAVAGARPRAVVFALAGLLVLACGGRETPRDAPAESALETVDVAPSRDASASLAEEPVAVRREPAAGLSGVLPAGFPDDVPILRPSSLVDAGWRDDGAVEIVLASPAAPGETAAAYARLLGAAGWERAGSGSPGRWQKGARRLEVEILDSRPGSRLRVTATP